MTCCRTIKSSVTPAAPPRVGPLPMLRGPPSTISNSLLSNNQAKGGSGTTPSSVDVGRGGGISNGAGRTLLLSASTFADNQAIGGSNSTAGTNDQASVGGGTGGGLDNAGAATITDSTFEHNQARG